MMDLRIASDRVIPDASSVRSARRTSSSNRTDTACIMPESVSQNVIQPDVVPGSNNTNRSAVVAGAVIDLDRR